METKREEEYNYYETLCEHIETFIDYGFPEEYLALSNEEYNKIKYEAYKNSNHKYHDELHERRLNGERI